jgi:hypothetical protein
VNPLSSKFREDFIEMLQKIVGRVGPDGVFLDYFYVPLGPFDNESIHSFSSHMNANLSVTDIVDSPEILGMFFEWRNDVMYDFLRSIRREIPEADLSVFIIMLEEALRLARGQDVARFAGVVDFIVPNTYHVVAMRSASWVGDGVLALKASGARSIWSGIQGYDIEPRELSKAVRSALKAGADGVVIFRYGTMTKEHWAHVQRGFAGSLPVVLYVLPATIAVLAGVLWLRRTRTRAEKSARKARRRGRPKR